MGLEADPGAAVPSIAPPIAPEPTTVEISFVPDGDGTTVHVVHSGLPSDATATFTSLGWTGDVERLASRGRRGGRRPGPVHYDALRSPRTQLGAAAL
jgi:hypothetical protein